MTDWTYNPDRGLPSKIKRRLTQYRRAAPATVSGDNFVVSFTFDDFPKSALNGADIIEKYGGHAGFYACTSMVGKTGPYGEMFDRNTLEELQSRQHEIGSHTHSHMDCAQRSMQEVLDDVSANLSQLADLGVEEKPTSFAFPFGETSFETKKSLRQTFKHCRGILPGTNVGLVDTAQLKCWELDGNADNALRAQKAIEDATKTGGWVIIFTHDVAQDHTQYGTSPDVIETLCKLAIDSGAEILAPTSAGKRFGI
jgi:peptidoglycan/xylan/chitin deacetylase (PgdA/CDA1 family)